MQSVGTLTTVGTVQSVTDDLPMMITDGAGFYTPGGIVLIATLMIAYLKSTIINKIVHGFEFLWMIGLSIIAACASKAFMGGFESIEWGNPLFTMFLYGSGMTSFYSMVIKRRFGGSKSI